nr:polyphosphate polymerase domain-containing protein [Flexivirga oryzae]
MNYDSVYFDSVDLQLFRSHQQGRRCRFKVRIRTYADSGARFVEVKTKSGRGETVKHRMPYPDGPRTALDESAADFVQSVIREQYATTAPPLHAMLDSVYHRATLVDPAAGERLTCDVDLRWSTSDGDFVVGPDRVLLESKTTNRGRVDGILAAWGIRPLSMSKYPIGTALLRPELAANRWNRLLRREFGWQRAVLRGTR